MRPTHTSHAGPAHRPAAEGSSRHATHRRAAETTHPTHVGPGKTTAVEPAAKAAAMKTASAKSAPSHVPAPAEPAAVSSTTAAVPAASAPSMPAGGIRQTEDNCCNECQADGRMPDHDIVPLSSVPLWSVARPGAGCLSFELSPL